MILTLGYDTLPEGDAFPPCDAPDDCFRVRLIVTLLETCGSYFDRGASRAKLDRFLAYFQRYVLAKPCLPIDQAFDVADLFGALRPKLVRHERFEDACAACAAIEAAEAAAEEAAAAAAAAAARAAPGDAAAAAAAAGAPVEDDSGSDDDGDDGGSGSDGDDMDADDADGDADGDEDAAAAAAEGGDAFDADAMDDDHLDDDDDDDKDDEDEELSLRTRRSVVPKEEEDAFARELSAALGEAPGGAGASKPGFGLRPLSKGPLPLLSLGSGGGGASGGGGFGSSAGGGAGGATVSFKMLTRRDGRNSTRELHVPIASEMATLVAAQQEAEEAERSELKRLVLDQVALSDSNAAAADAAMHPAGRVLFTTAGVRGGDRYRRKLRS
jgi:regulator of nonsense transcripts 2